MKIRFSFSPLLILTFSFCSNQPHLSQSKQLTSVNSITPKEIVDKKYLLGKVDCTHDSLFSALKFQNSSRIFYLRKETAAALLQMFAAAEHDGIELQLISAIRSFSDQKTIWERKWTEYTYISDSLQRVKTILKYSAMPGTSRHHWGTNVDLNSLEPSYFDTPNGKKV